MRIWINSHHWFTSFKWEGSQSDKVFRRTCPIHGWVCILALLPLGHANVWTCRSQNDHHAFWWMSSIAFDVLLFGILKLFRMLFPSGKLHFSCAINAFTYFYTFSLSPRRPPHLHHPHHPHRPLHHPRPQYEALNMQTLCILFKSFFVSFFSLSSPSWVWQIQLDAVNHSLALVRQSSAWLQVH